MPSSASLRHTTSEPSSNITPLLEANTTDRSSWVTLPPSPRQMSRLTG
ncbi:hypothetical protein EVA_01200 [gut metagenome]|uniref:Uncharacterized protein n=1 Tax=gut metagenome TaxID=749906 RepID=J9H3B3_9ZZZZ